jgi:type II secretory pathway component PulF
LAKVADFIYKATDSVGTQSDGVIQASDRRAAVADLAAQGLFPSQISEKSAYASVAMNTKGLSGIFKFKSSRVSSKDILTMTGELATAIKAGLPLHDAIEIVAEQQHKPAMKELLDDLASLVSGGDSFSDALAKHPKEFSKLYISMVLVGETGGILDETIKQLNDLLGREEKIKSNMKSATMYPLMLLVVGIVSVAILLTWIFPKIIETITETGALLPLPTRMLLGLSGFMADYGLWVIAALVACWYAFHSWKSTEQGRYKFDNFKLSIPVMGSVLRAVAVGRFARTLGALTTSGITILRGLAVVRDTLGNEVLGQEVDTVAEKVSMGESLAEPLKASGYFPPLLVQIVSIGEQTGRLDELLLNAADTFDEEADTAIGRFMSLFPSLLIVILAMVIGFIIVAMLLPILTMDFGG